MQRHAPAQIWEPDSVNSITTVGRAKQGRQGLILCNRNYLAIAGGPASGSEVKSVDANFANKWIHVHYSRLGKNPLVQMMKFTQRNGGMFS